MRASPSPFTTRSLPSLLSVLSVLLLADCQSLGHAPAGSAHSRPKTRIYATSDDFNRFVNFWEFAPPPTRHDVEESTTSIPSTTSSPTTTVPTTRTTARTTTTSRRTTSTSTTTSTTVSTITTTVEWTTPTTVDLCDRSNDHGLLSRLKDSGVYNDIYMAVNFSVAVEQFPDLKRFSRPRSQYRCDETCERKSYLVRTVFNVETIPPVRLPERTWWVPDEWEGKERTERHPRSLPSMEREEKIGRRKSVLDIEKRAKLEAQIQNALHELAELTEEEDEKEEKAKAREEKEEDWESVDYEHSTDGRGRRVRRNPVSLAERNSGTAKGIVGTTIAVECEDRQKELRTANKDGFHFCPSCRAVRHLPKTFFPRVLNEVVCAEGTCLQDQGKCVQRFLPLKILHNSGSEECPQWKLVNINLRTCCDCVLSPYSPFARYLL